MLIVLYGETSYGRIMTSQHKTILIGIGVFLIFAVFVTGFSPVAPRTLEGRLDTIARDALSAREFRWARVSVDGQVATLSGRWPDAGTHDAAREAIWTSEWAGGVFSGGITKIVDLSVAQDGETTSRFIARYGADGLTISGIAPSDAARDELMAMAQVLFPGRTNIRLAARSDPDASRGWAQAGGQLLAGLARLDAGAAILDSNAAVLYGTAGDPASAEAALEAYQASPSPFTPVGWVMADDSSFGDATSSGNCARLLEAALSMGRMRFNPGSSAMSAEGRAGLEHVAVVVSACPEQDLIVSVRPVVAGDHEAELLAEARGETVKSTLTAFGLDAARIFVVVNGEQDQLVRITPDVDGES
jgi:outer membrane protein OmpA-like peptidoglycan-associated protein